jgi:hypothetical protein
LFVKVDSEHSDEFAAAMDAALSDGWIRAREAENDATWMDDWGKSGSRRRAKGSAMVG